MGGSKSAKGSPNPLADMDRGVTVRVIKRFILSYAFRVTNAHFVRDVLQYNTRDLYINLHKGVNVFFFSIS